MNNTFEFLTALCGIYDSDGEDAFKQMDMLVVYSNTLECSFKIYYKSMYTFKGLSHKDKIAEERGEILLKPGFMEFELIHNNIDKEMIKVLIFNKYQDMMNQSLYVTKVY